jgi:hypothetical protein
MPRDAMPRSWTPASGTEPTGDDLCDGVRKLASAWQACEGGLVERVEATLAAERHLEAVIDRVLSPDESRHLARILHRMGYGYGPEAL